MREGWAELFCRKIHWYAGWKDSVNRDTSPLYFRSVVNNQTDGTWVSNDQDPFDVPQADVYKYISKTQFHVGISSFESRAEAWDSMDERIQLDFI